MKTNIRLWQNLAEFFLELEMFQTKVVEKIKTHILCSVTFFFENRAVCEIMWKKYCRVGQFTGDNIIWRMRIACWVTKARIHTDAQIIKHVFPPPPPTATMVTRTLLSFKLYMTCLVF